MNMLFFNYLISQCDVVFFSNNKNQHLTGASGEEFLLFPFKRSKHLIKYNHPNKATNK